MTRSITAKAHAKINLFLEVTGKRPDGYHEIDTVMHSVTLCDIITITINGDSKEKSIKLSCDLDELECDESNLAYRAATAFYRAALIEENTDINIHIEKHIPIAAGLAGGSTDAACVLRSLNNLYGFPLSEKELCSVGASIGADVPFCIMQSPARCTGIGEIMDPCGELPDCHILIAIKSGNKISTKEAYEKIDAFSDRQPRHNNMTELLGTKDLARLSQELYNVFSKITPATDTTVKSMLKYGAVGALMSGSGPSVFGLFDTLQKAEQAYAFLRNNDHSAFLCKPLRLK